MKSVRGRLLLGVLFLTVLIGCATPTIDWASRVGTYTYDQSVQDYGPPYKEARLDDGTVVADWLMRRGYTYVYGPTVYYGWQPGWGYYGPMYPSYPVVSPSRFLRLTFDRDHRLKAWAKYYQ